jgi:hypothetical protein
MTAAFGRKNHTQYLFRQQGRNNQQRTIYSTVISATRLTAAAKPWSEVKSAAA